MNCKNCGCENQDNAKFCFHCGKPLVSEDLSQSETQQNNSQYGNAPYNNVPQNNGQYDNIPYNNAPQNNGQYGNVPYNNAPQNNGQYGNMPYNNAPQGSFQQQNEIPQYYYPNEPMENSNKKGNLFIVLGIIALIIAIVMGVIVAIHFLGNDNSTKPKEETTVTTTVPAGNSIDDVIGFFNDGSNNADVDTLKKCMPDFVADEMDELTERYITSHKNKMGIKVTFSKEAEKSITNDKSTEDSSLSWKDYIQKDLESKTGYDGGKVTEVKKVTLNMSMEAKDDSINQMIQEEDLPISSDESFDLEFYKYGDNWYMYNIL